MWVGILDSMVEASQAFLVLGMGSQVAVALPLLPLVVVSKVPLVVVVVLGIVVGLVVAEACPAVAVVLPPCFVPTGCAVMLMVGPVPAFVVGLVVVVCLLAVVVVYVLGVAPVVVVVAEVVVPWAAKLVSQLNPQAKRSQRLCGVEVEPNLDPRGPQGKRSQRHFGMSQEWASIPKSGLRSQSGLLSS